MSGKSGKWFYMQYFQNLAWTASSLFLSVFIWQKTGSTEYLYKYYLANFAAIPVFGLLGAFASRNLSAKFGFVSSYLTNIFLLGCAAYATNTFLAMPVFFGLVNGAAIGLYSVASNATKQLLFSENVSAATARLSSVTGLNSLLVPLLGSFVVAKYGNYNVVFMVGASSLVLALMFAFSIKFGSGGENRGTVSVAMLWKSSDFRKLVFFSFLWGIKSGLEWTVFGVVILKLVGGEIASWGIVNFLAALVGIVSGLVYSKMFAGRADALALVFSSVVYTALGMFLISEYSLVSFVLYFWGSAVVSTFISSSTTRLFADVYKDTDISARVSLDNYYATLEWPLAVGRMLPVWLLYSIKSSLGEDGVLFAIFFVVSTIPLICTFVFQRMKSFHKETLEASG